MRPSPELNSLMQLIMTALSAIYLKEV